MVRLVGVLAAGQNRGQILAAYPYLESQDIDEALHYATLLAEDETIAGPGALARLRPVSIPLYDQLA